MTTATEDPQASPLPPLPEGTEGWFLHEESRWSRTWRKEKLEITYLRYGYGYQPYGEPRESKAPYAIKRDCGGQHETVGSRRHARIRTFATFAKAAAALERIALLDDLESYVLACNSLRSAEAAAQQDYSGIRISNLRETQRRHQWALEKIAAWAEAKAREELAGR